MGDGKDYQWIAKVGAASTVGIVLVVATAIGYAFGYWLDGKFGTSPWLMIVFTLLGVTAGFVELFRTVIRLSK